MQIERSKAMKRKKRLVAVCLTLILFICSSISSVASDSTVIKVTDTLVLQMAERFADAFDLNSEIEAQNPIKFYDESGQAIGYIVNYYTHGIPSGYVVFDITHESLISEYSFDARAKNPYESILDTSMSTQLLTMNEGSTRLCKTSPFTYEIINLNESGYVSYANSDNTSTWNDVFLSIQDVYEDYTLVSTNHLPEFIAISEEYIEDEIGRYACVVSALYACAMYYGATDYYDLEGDYFDLWQMTNTTTVEITNGITYGSTPFNRMGPGFVNFCASRGVTVRQVTRNSPSYSFFTSTIDSADMAVVGCGIMVNEYGEVIRSGHGMAVEGYATLRGVNTGKTVRTLMVFDGWDEEVRYLNYDFEDWTDMTGTSFNG